MTKRVVSALAVLLLAAAPSHAEGPKPSSVSVASDDLRALHEALMNGMAGIHTLDMSGDVDIDIATVIMHYYRQTIALAQIELHHGKNADARKAAQSVIAASEHQIAELRKLQAKSTIAKRS